MEYIVPCVRDGMISNSLIYINFRIDSPINIVVLKYFHIDAFPCFFLFLLPYRFFIVLYIDKRIVIKIATPMALLEQYTAYSVSVSAMEIFFSSGNTPK